METVPIAWRPAQCVGGQFGFGADVAEVALVDREGGGEGDRDRFDVGVAGAGLEVEAQARVLGAGGLLVAAELGDRHLRGEGQARAVDGVEVGGEGDRGALVADPFGADREGASSWSG